MEERSSDPYLKKKKTKLPQKSPRTSSFTSLAKILSEGELLFQGILGNVAFHLSQLGL